MKIVLLALWVTAFYSQSLAQNADTSWKKKYRATAEKVNDLIHTRLEAAFDYSKAQLNGKVWIMLKPHFYPADSLQLDAKGMAIHSVALQKNSKETPLQYRYDGMILTVYLDRTYRNTERYTVHINYTAKPNEFNAQGSAAITDAKGLYFINPLGKEKNKPTQIWTQGETEATSVWVPTIDKPNQKTTQEIFMTVPSKYVTLSNGKLVRQTKNPDGTRTDYWKMDQPHAPYLFFMGVGDYAVIKDSYKGKEVSYFVEKEYAPVARQIFGRTPEMMDLFSRLTGVEYPWVKYAQIVGRDYVSGAMENTTATLHQESAQQDARQLLDGNYWEKTIAHELFHQWFGDYVTAESWSNLTLNESFARFSEYLWFNHAYGKDAGDAHNYGRILTYLNSSTAAQKDLVRFEYRDKEDMFDAVSYDKGSVILRMLQNYVGDSAFFKALNLYLTTNKYKSAEAHQLRLAFEEVTGKDLNWFWNQWYYGNGHPKLNITYSYDNNSKKARVIVEQTTDKLFTLPVRIEVWNGNTSQPHDVWVVNKMDTFDFAVPSKPELINFDADKLLLASKTENKTAQEYLFQYQHAKNYVDRREAIDFALKHQEDQAAMDIIVAGLRDSFAALRSYTAARINLTARDLKSRAESILVSMAQTDPDKIVKATALLKLGDYKTPAYKEIFEKAIDDSSYTVAGYALEALGKVDSIAALHKATVLADVPAKGALSVEIAQAFLNYGDERTSDKMFQRLDQLPFGQEKFNTLKPVVNFAKRLSSDAMLKRSVRYIVDFRNEMPTAYREQLDGYIIERLKDLQNAKQEGGQKEQADYVGQVIAGFSKASF